MLRLLLIALIVSTASGRKFQNPVSDDRAYQSPGVLLYRGQYYAVTSSFDADNPDKFPLQVSSDLQNWTRAGYALPEKYLPAWSNWGYYIFPELHQIGENDFRLIFTAAYKESGQYSIGVGYSQNVLGPYTVTNQPLAGNRTWHFVEPTLVQDGTRKYLVWREAHQINARELNPDCLGFIEGSEEKTIMLSDMPWEGTFLFSPWYFRRPDAWYLFYTGYPGNNFGIGVARSQNPLGPFEKLDAPILVTDDAFREPGFCSVVPDIFNNTTAMVYQAYPDDPNKPFMMAQTVEWGSDGWPYMNPN